MHKTTKFILIVLLLLLNSFSVSYCGSSVLSSNNADVTFRENLIYEGLIGSGMFKDKILTIDIPNKRLLVRK